MLYVYRHRETRWKKIRITDNTKIGMKRVKTYWMHFYCVLSCIYSLLVERNPCECWNVSVKFPCTLLVYLCLSSADLFIFFYKSSSLLFLFLCCLYFCTFPFHVVSFVFLHFFLLLCTFIFLFLSVHGSILPQTLYRPRGKESTEVRISQNKGKESENSRLS